MGNLNYMYTPYSSLVAKKNDNSRAFYMLAELIDNSIASWDTKNMKNEQLIINIDLNMNKRYIKVVDNAFGMNEQELADSIILNQEKEGNVMNMFGVGMKNAAFWFGEDLIVKSKSRESQKIFETSILTSKVLDLSERATWQVVESDLENFGTVVIFDGIYKDKIIKPRDFSNIIIPILNNKYKNYILNNNVKITFNYTYDKKSEIRELAPKNIKAENSF